MHNIYIYIYDIYHRSPPPTPSPLWQLCSIPESPKEFYRHIEKDRTHHPKIPRRLKCKDTH